VIFLAEFLLTPRNFVLRVEEDSELLLEFTNTKFNARTCLLYPLPRRFHRYVFRVFHFFLPSSLKFERADFPLLSLKPEEDFLRARIKERKKKGRRSSVLDDAMGFEKTWRAERARKICFRADSNSIVSFKADLVVKHALKAGDG